MSEITEFHLSTRRGKGSMLKQAFLSGLLQLPLLYLLALWSELILNNRQISGQEAAVVGAFNTIRQSSNQFNLVNVGKLWLAGSSSAVNPADSLQSAKQAASAVGVEIKFNSGRQGNARQILSPPP